MESFIRTWICRKASVTRRGKKVEKGSKERYLTRSAQIRWKVKRNEIHRDSSMLCKSMLWEIPGGIQYFADLKYLHAAVTGVAAPTLPRNLTRWYGGRLGRSSCAGEACARRSGVAGAGEPSRHSQAAYRGLEVAVRRPPAMEAGKEARAQSVFVCGVASTTAKVRVEGEVRRFMALISTPPPASEQVMKLHARGKVYVLLGLDGRGRAGLERRRLEPGLGVLGVAEEGAAGLDEGVSHNEPANALELDA